MDRHHICYNLKFASGETRTYDVELDSQSLTMVSESTLELPDWTALDYHQCPHCPLKVETTPVCPLARELVPLATQCGDIASLHNVHVEVVTPERTISRDTTAQKAFGSLMGLIIPVSGCPQAAFFRPMARFHVPFASEQETAYRVASMYLLSQYFQRQHGKDVTFTMDGLRRIYQNMHTVNRTLSKRLRDAARGDSTVSALILLDVFTVTLPRVFSDALEDLAYLFELPFQSP